MNEQHVKKTNVFKYVKQPKNVRHHSCQHIQFIKVIHYIQHVEENLFVVNECFD